MSAPASAAFDAVAADYDRTFTETALGRMLRRRVWEVYDRRLPRSGRALDLACGTGEDALWLARRGLRVLGCDGSGRMLERAAAKAAAAGVAAEFRRLSFDDVIGGALEPPFDAACSDFGGVNVLGDWRPLARALGRLVRPGGSAILVPMGPRCLWDPRRKDGAAAQVGSTALTIRYPSPRRLRADMEPWFEHRETRSLGLLLPTTAYSALVERRARLFAALDLAERAAAAWTGGWGDHYISVFERR